MSQFTYRARTAGGDVLEGVVQAASLTEAGRMLRGEGKFVVSLSPAREVDLVAGPGAGGWRHGGRVRREEVVNFTHRLAVMMETGVPVSEALRCVADQTRNPRFAEVLGDVAAHLRGGGSLSEALGRHPRVFPPLMVSLVGASEVSGTMSQMLGRVSIYLDKQQRMARKLRGALTYPLVLVGLVLAAIVFMLTFLMPRFAVVYAGRGATLPMPTRMLLVTSELATDWWMFWLPAVVAAAAALVVAARTAPGRWALHTLAVRLPVVGPLMSKLYLARACQAMATLLDAGVPVLDMVAAARQVTPNTHFQRFWDRVDEQLRRGVELSTVMAGSSLIPPDVVQMIQAGEKAGRLGPVLNRIGEHGEQSFDEQVQQATQLIEPAMIVCMGTIIGFVALAMLLPIFRISNVIAG
ncbi:MAG: type II secretion system F family protein [Phycisphaeraceae bacterium]